jgi:hypothetical protein
LAPNDRERLQLEDAMAPPLDKDLLEILVCPDSKAALVLDGDRLVSTDATTRRAYRIDDGIPVMLIEESVVLSEGEWREVMERHDVDLKNI